MRKRIDEAFGFVPQTTLMASAFVALISVLGFIAAPFIYEPEATMYIEPNSGHAYVGDTFGVDVVVDSRIPVNVFKGEIAFDPSRVQVEAIDYNVSIADLWAEKPWYENGAGTINFAGGTTQKGGFIGSGSLIHVTFKTVGEAETILRLHDARILKHDGLGTDAVVGSAIDAIFNIEEKQLATQTVAEPKTTETLLVIGVEPPSTDLNNDGKQSATDMSIFVIHMFGNNPRYDFNQDGSVNTKDLSILMSAQ